MKLPVKKSANPTQNAPTWALGLVGLFGAIKAVADGNLWVAAVVFVACVAFGVFTQVFTTPGE